MTSACIRKSVFGSERKAFSISSSLWTGHSGHTESQNHTSCLSNTLCACTQGRHGWLHDSMRPMLPKVEKLDIKTFEKHITMSGTKWVHFSRECSLRIVCQISSMNATWSRLESDGTLSKTAVQVCLIRWSSKSLLFMYLSFEWTLLASMVSNPLAKLILVLAGLASGLFACHFTRCNLHPPSKVSSKPSLGIETCRNQ